MNKNLIIFALLALVITAQDFVIEATADQPITLDLGLTPAPVDLTVPSSTLESVPPVVTTSSQSETTVAADGTTTTTTATTTTSQESSTTREVVIGPDGTKRTIIRERIIITDVNE